MARTSFKKLLKITFIRKSDKDNNGSSSNKQGEDQLKESASKNKRRSNSKKTKDPQQLKRTMTDESAASTNPRSSTTSVPGGSSDLMADHSTSRLQDDLDAFMFEFMDSQPQEVIEILVDKAEQLAMAGIVERAIKQDDVAPHFNLPDQDGKMIRVNELIRSGPVIISFFKGEWCPYCNIELKALQDYLPQFKARGASLVAIAPQLPQFSESTAKKHDITFPVLSDVGCKVGSEYGLDFQLDEDLRPYYEKWGIDPQPYNTPDEPYKLPVPATYVIDTDGTVLFSFVNTDYTKRAEPLDILQAIPDYGDAAAGSSW